MQVDQAQRMRRLLLLRGEGVVVVGGSTVSRKLVLLGVIDEDPPSHPPDQCAVAPAVPSTAVPSPSAPPSQRGEGVERAACFEKKEGGPSIRRCVACMFR